MSTELFLINLDKKEYVKADGNNSYADWKDRDRNDYPQFVMFLLTGDWINDKITFVQEHKGFELIENMINITFDKFNEFKLDRVINSIHKMRCTLDKDCLHCKLLNKTRQ